MIQLDEVTYKKLPAEERDWIMFKNVEAVENRVYKLERHKIFHKVAAFLGGIVGGVGSYFGFKLGGD